ncbi:MAG TPA: DNA polymerase I [Chitinophagaceae bacterium]|nr:DNA polymerase I [Chitinophagaceae bacterium]
MEKKLFLLDAMALIYRAYYALIRNPRMTTKKKNTNAQFGFTTALYNLLQKENPTHIAIAFDTHAPTERHITYEAYKANREDTPEDILKAIPDIKKIAKGFNIPCIELDGYEADDIIGTLAIEAAQKGYTTYMVTPDKDYGQLVSDQIFMYKPPKGGNKESIMGPKEICAKWEIDNVSQVIDILGLMGDAADNIPGIPGVGEKTAIKLLKKYTSVEELVASADDIKGKLGEKVRANKEQALLSKKLATIITDVPISFNEKELIITDRNTKVLEDIFNELEFRSLGRRILGEDFSITDNVPKGGQLDMFASQDSNKKETSQTENAVKNLESTEHDYQLVETEKDRKRLITQLLQQKEISFDTETTSTNAHIAEIVGMSFSFKKGTAFYVPTPENWDDTKNILEEFRQIFEKKDILIIGQNIKYDLLVIGRYGYTIKGRLFDTMLAHYLIDPDGRRNMDTLAFKYLHYQPQPISDLIGKKGKKQGNMRNITPEKVSEYAGEDADITFQLKEIFLPLLEEKKVKTLFDKVEMPTIYPILSMESEGVKVDKTILEKQSKAINKEIKERSDSIYEQAGTTFNLASPKQLGAILFDKLKLVEKPKKTKTGQYKTGEDILRKLASKHQIVEEILIYRELSKLKSTYIDALPKLINKETGRIHTSYNQAVTVTGRLSSNNPNLQNIPVRTERGRAIREAFVPRDNNHILISADYSQIELRIIASIAGDEHMIAAYKNGQDIHTTTASKVYKIPLEEVTQELRRNAKSVNFGIIYGVSAFGLSENINVSRTEAKQLINTYFEEYPAIKKFMDSQKEFAKEHGYVETLMGRKRWLPDINSSNSFVRGFAERNAINMPIQGTAADMIKLAMVEIDKELRSKKSQSKMILQVHDELVFDVPKEELEDIQPLIKDKMENAMKMEVPLEVELGTGKNWLEAH